MDTIHYFKFQSSQIITLKERDDGNKKKQRMEKEAMLQGFKKTYFGACIVDSLQGWRQNHLPSALVWIDGFAMG